MIKLIAIDMDGTLVHSDLKIASENIRAIKQAQEKGIQVVVATGRSYTEAKIALDEANLSCPVICINGAEIRNESGKIIYSTSLQPKVYHQICEQLDDLGVYYEIYTNKGTFSKDFEKAMEVIIDIFQSAGEHNSYFHLAKFAKKRLELGLVKPMNQLKTMDNEDINFYKFLIFSFDEQELKEAEERVKGFSEIVITSSGKENIEISHVRAQKGVAVQFLLEKNGIPAAKAMAIGDNYNDLSMFQIVGRAVAMGNAPDEIKNQCHFVTETNDHHGVAHAINDILNN